MNLNHRSEIYNVIIAILLAYTFAIALRFIYVSEIIHVKAFYWHGQLMINNVDGYYYAEGARDIIDGVKSNYLSPTNAPLSLLTAYLAKFFHIPLDVLIFYMPGVFGALIVVPLILIGRALGNLWMGFLAALLGGVAWSYYHRTMFGYYDTDMLTVVLPTFAVWAVVCAFTQKNEKFFFLAPLFMSVMQWWHDGLYNVTNGIFIMSFIYVLYLKFFKKQDIYKETIFVLFLIIPLLKIGLLPQLALILIYQIAILKFKVSYFQENGIKFLLFVFFIYFLFVGLPWLSSIIKNSYFTRAVSKQEGGIHYFDVVNTIREASKIDWDVFVHRISGSWIGFILGAIGYLALLIRYPIMIVSIPMVVLGFFALRGGLRFTIFAVPFFALGNAYLFVLLAKFISDSIKDNVKHYAYYGLSLLFMLGVIYPNYKHMFKYVVPPTFNANEVAVLNELKKTAKPSDYVLTWWDYGYPVRYYAKVSTLIDGAKHSGDVNWPVSFALTRPQLPSYNAAILDVYLTQKDYEEHKKFDFIKQVMEMYHLKSPTEVEKFLYNKINLPKIKNDIYYYLPFRMLNIFPTVALFSYIDINTGEVNDRPIFMQLLIKGVDNRGLVLAKGLILSKNGYLIQDNQKIPINKLILTYYDEKGKLVKKEETLNPKSQLNVIIMRSFGRVLILGNKMLNSTYIQLYVLENYDKKLFKPVILTPWAKVYKVVK
ncbi:STT3 domain-containing protein [Caminibacter pacificus]|uniref:Dolichyl-diphosphooligosaccharide--protein glycosyltransferase/undecaprenyl-diphosphooligosaccharide--protein glycosyltransferase n=1 Tax=Caminibacter pacificus TaxID=1424653 RepID=A0AAJ4RBV1_9BACT|nr:STT3 domain-containing protein [Caminibacter pacificus]QCI29022.1 peptide transporter [Caminibacter pacificus]ROR39167.1 dolichyl-diphosphooligosaccharide--protein glycosyltransferase/undecaprenyl-diphosphooligosaccharide--protein glycosyltransferase [Caminibacter pacificus]